MGGGGGGGNAGRLPCRYYMRGFCHNGSNCTFRHEQVMMAAVPSVPAPAPPPRPVMPPRTTSKVCIHYASGTCAWGSKCHFLHVSAPVTGIGYSQSSGGD